eukprot:PITA_23816
MSTIQLLLAIAAQSGWKVHQMDVKSAFLNGDFEEEVYMTKPQGFKLQDFQRSLSNPNLYVKSVGNDIILLVIYVDDIIITSNGAQLLEQIRLNLCQAFDMKNLGLLHYFLDIKVWQTGGSIFIPQSNPKAEHWVAAKRVLTYVKGPPDFSILYSTSKDPRLIHFTNSDWVGFVDDRKSTYGYVFSLGTGAVIWTSKKQQEVALSSTEAEYQGTVKAACEAVWLHRMRFDMKMSQARPSPLFCDNQGVLKLAKNPVFHERTKHVESHCHFIQQLVEDGTLILQYVPIEDQNAYILTKSLSPDKFVKFRGQLGVVKRITIKGGY